MPKRSARRGSLRRQFLRWAVLPLFGLWVINLWLDYSGAIAAANITYDRTLLASARVIAERLHAHDGRLLVDLSYIALDSFEYDNRGRVYYKVSDVDGRPVAGYDDLPDMPAGTPRNEFYPALAHFYNATYRGRDIRAVTLFQPVNENGVQGMARIHVAETRASRDALAHWVLNRTLLGQGMLIALALVLVMLAMSIMLRPIHRLHDEVVARAPGNLAPLDDSDAYRELKPLVDAVNQHMAQLKQILDAQRGFAANAAHQLRTPLAILMAQADHALGSGDPELMKESLGAMRSTLRDMRQLTQNLLLLGRLEEGAAVGFDAAPIKLDALVRDLCMTRVNDAQRANVDLGLECERAPPPIRGNAALLKEMLANLLDNALRHTPVNGAVTVRLGVADRQAWIEVEDSGIGIPQALRERALNRYESLSARSSGWGLGLAIARDICRLHDAVLSLHDGQVLGGLLVRIEFRAVT